MILFFPREDRWYCCLLDKAQFLVPRLVEVGVNKMIRTDECISRRLPCLSADRVYPVDLSQPFGLPARISWYSGIIKEIKMYKIGIISFSSSKFLILY
jgi:hypothetical protein